MTVGTLNNPSDSSMLAYILHYQVVAISERVLSCALVSRHVSQYPSKFKNHDLLT